MEFLSSVPKGEVVRNVNVARVIIGRHTKMCRTLQVVEVSNKWGTEGMV